jgi:hypothetical protein
MMWCITVLEIGINELESFKYSSKHDTFQGRRIAGGLWNTCHRTHQSLVELDVFDVTEYCCNPTTELKVGERTLDWLE